MAAISLLFLLFISVYRTEASDDVSLQSLETLVQHQAAVIQQQSTVNQQQAAQLQALQSQVDSLQATCNRDIGELRARQQKQAAFSVTFPRNIQHPFDIGANAAIKFPEIVTNVGNGYASHSGIFTAPYAGIYAFFLKLRADNNHMWINIGLYKGSSLLVEVVVEGSEDPNDQNSGFVVTHLLQGDQVYVRRVNGGTNLMTGQFTTFSGVLVSAD